MKGCITWERGGFCTGKFNVTSNYTSVHMLVGSVQGTSAATETTAPLHAGKILTLSPSKVMLPMRDVDPI